MIEGACSICRGIIETDVTTGSGSCTNGGVGGGIDGSPGICLRLGTSPPTPTSLWLCNCRDTLFDDLRYSSLADCDTIFVFEDLLDLMLGMFAYRPMILFLREFGEFEEIFAVLFPTHHQIDRLQHHQVSCCRSFA